MCVKGCRDRYKNWLGLQSQLQWYIESANSLLEKPVEMELDEEEGEAEDFANRISSNIALLEKCNKD